MERKNSLIFSTPPVFFTLFVTNKAAVKAQSEQPIIFLTDAAGQT